MMTTCPSCSREVSTAAAACPGCGHQFKSAGGISLRDPIHILGLLLVALIFAVVIWAAVKTSR